MHATPRDPLDEYLLKDPGMWAKRVHNVEADIVCVGHTHVQFNLTVGGVVVLNPGSVGLPRDGDPRAAFAIIDGNKIELKRSGVSHRGDRRPRRARCPGRAGPRKSPRRCFAWAAFRQSWND